VNTASLLQFLFSGLMVGAIYGLVALGLNIVFNVDHLETLSPLNPLGLKGVGESGALPVPAVLASAIEDAVGPAGGRVTRMPLGPARLLELLPPPLPDPRA
jgi:CO/xanthine dehydrogenase Mo-binding subunit